MDEVTGNALNLTFFTLRSPICGAQPKISFRSPHFVETLSTQAGRGIGGWVCCVPSVGSLYQILVGLLLNPLTAREGAQNIKSPGTKPGPDWSPPMRRPGVDFLLFTSNSSTFGWGKISQPD